MSVRAALLTMSELRRLVPDGDALAYARLFLLEPSRVGGLSPRDRNRNGYFWLRRAAVLGNDSGCAQQAFQMLERDELSLEDAEELDRAAGEGARE